MSINHSEKFSKTVKGKIIIIFLLSCMALFAAWLINKLTFEKMLFTVEDIFKPNDKLRITNSISYHLVRLDQLQRDGNITKAERKIILAENKLLYSKLDSLANLYFDNEEQLARINSIKILLADRDKQLLNFLRVKENLISTKVFSEEVNELNQLLQQRALVADSGLLTTQTTTSTKVITQDKDNQNRGFLSRLFGRKKEEVYKVIEEELKVQHDTINPQIEDSLLKNMGSALKKIETDQRAKSTTFLRREADLALSSSKLTQKILQILQEVEADAVVQLDQKSAEAKAVLEEGVSQMTIILVVFLLLTLGLLILIFTDIAKTNKYRKALEIEKQNAEYHSLAKQRFLSNMSHEIRTPLQSILGYSELAVKDEKPSPQYINAIYQSSAHLLQIVNEILDYNRIVSGEFKFHNQNFNMQLLLDEIIALAKPLAEQKNLDLEVNIDIEEGELVYGDEFRLKQILLNLISNAIKFTFEGKVLLSVSYKAFQGDLYYNFLVADTGIGFNQQDVDKIFNEFEQVDNEAQSVLNKNGSGLGLAIVKSLVENLGGRIGVKSSLNKGSEFTVNLKYQIAEAMEASGNDVNLTTKSFDGKVWIIDDDKLILDLCGILFEKNRINYRSFNRPAEVLNAEVDDDLKVVFIDMRMPEMNGVELCKLLKAKLPTDVLYYAITAQVLPEERTEVLNSGFYGLILKPFVEKDLISVLGVFMRQEDIDFDASQYTYDLSSISKMTFGDEVLLHKILRKFVEDCESDIFEISNSIEENEADNVRLLVHRLAGRTAQLGANELAAVFRNLELDIDQYGLNPENNQNILNASEELRIMIQKINVEVLTTN